MKIKNWIFSNLKIIVLVLIFLFSSIYVSAQSARVTNCNFLNLRNGPGVEHSVIRLLRAGDSVEILEEDGAWYKVSCNGQEGWVHGLYLERNSVEDTKEALDTVGYVNVAVANVRSGSSTVYGVIGKLVRNQEVKIIERSGSWYSIITPNGNRGWIHVNLVSPNISQVSSSSSRSLSTNNSTRENVVNLARGLMGTRYLWGGSSPNGFDCSGLVQYVYGRHGINLNRTSASQARQGSWVSRDNLQSGDLVFFNTSGTGAVSHVGIYIGGGDMIHASSSRRSVIISSINSSYFRRSYVTGRSVIR